ncbi:MAG: hypothetical protein NZM04_06480 [Methylacidiphilales bacterium]|nr:hypothetical protein [Candidatus Methylacidiphilales bacterium]MDW8349419.1 hypothetical protein [Verrucomicrobiae bacterium]
MRPSSLSTLIASLAFTSLTAASVLTPITSFASLPLAHQPSSCACCENTPPASSCCAPSPSQDASPAACSHAPFTPCHATCLCSPLSPYPYTLSLPTSLLPCPALTQSFHLLDETALSRTERPLLPPPRLI